MKNKKGLSFLEYAMSVAIIVAALLTMQMYMKRGLQGKFRQAADELGEQYCPKESSGDLTIVQTSNYEMETKIQDIDADGKFDNVTTTTNIIYDETTKTGKQTIWSAPEN